MSDIKLPKTQAPQHLGTGRRKSAVARVRLAGGTGKILVNGRPFENYFPTEALRVVAVQPLTLTGTAEKFDAALRPQLKTEGLLTRDSRMKERKKYGQPGARKRFQYSKR